MIVLPAMLFVFWASPVNAAQFSAADMADGYGGRVLEKVLEYWQPPAGISGSVTVMLRIGSDGRPLYCEPVKRSGNALLDETPCRAVLQAGIFPAPPHETVTQVFLSMCTDGVLPAPAEGEKKRTFAEEILYRATPYVEVPGGITGSYTVEVVLRINPSDGLESCSISKSSGREDLDQSVVAALRHEGVIPELEPFSGTRNVRLHFTLCGN